MWPFSPWSKLSSRRLCSRSVHNKSKIEADSNKSGFAKYKMIAAGDPLLVRWGLHELEGSGHVVDNAERGGDKNGDVTVNDVNQQRSEVAVDPVRYAMPPPRVASTASDALIAQALQEEFQQLAAAEAAGVSGPSAPVDEQVQVSGNRPQSGVF